MPSAFGYLAQRFFHSLWLFLYDWFAGGFLTIWHLARQIVFWFDRRLALGITLRHFFEPMFGDFAFLGRILGFGFRVARVGLAMILYSVIAILAVAFYFSWLLFPFALFYLALR